MIGRRGIPPKVIKAVVRRVPVSVARLATVWAWANKGEKNEAMRKHVARSLVLPHGGGEIAAASGVKGKPARRSKPHAPDRPIRADFV